MSEADPGYIERFVAAIEPDQLPRGEAKLAEPPTEQAEDWNDEADDTELERPGGDGNFSGGEQ